jgi:hypothetical protein
MSNRVSGRHLTNHCGTNLNIFREWVCSNHPALIIPHPYGANAEGMFPGSLFESQYVWPRPSQTGFIVHVGDTNDYLGCYLAKVLCSLLDFGWLCRGIGLILCQGILDVIIKIWADGERRIGYEIADLCSRLPDSDCSSEVMTVPVQGGRVWQNGR